jgi:hypothetical protein
VETIKCSQLQFQMRLWSGEIRLKEIIFNQTGSFSLIDFD